MRNSVLFPILNSLLTYLICNTARHSLVSAAESNLLNLLLVIEPGTLFYEAVWINWGQCRVFIDDTSCTLSTEVE